MFTRYQEARDCLAAMVAVHAFVESRQWPWFGAQKIESPTLLEIS